MTKHLLPRILAAFLGALFLAYSAIAAPDRTITFSGEVNKDQRFEKQIGEDLYFCLLPQELGWTVFIGNKEELDNNFAGVVTPPYHGINQLYIEGWHFRNADNSGPNEAGEKNVNAPQHVREFNFVLTRRDYEKASDALKKTLWPYSFTAPELQEAERRQAHVREAEGVLTVTQLELNNLELARQAGVDHMAFEVQLHLPADLL